MQENNTIQLSEYLNLEYILNYAYSIQEYRERNELEWKRVETPVQWITQTVSLNNANIKRYCNKNDRSWYLCHAFDASCFNPNNDYIAKLKFITNYFEAQCLKYSNNPTKLNEANAIMQLCKQLYLLYCATTRENFRRGCDSKARVVDIDFYSKFNRRLTEQQEEHLT